MTTANTIYLAMACAAFAAFAVTLIFGCVYTATDPNKTKK